MAGHEIHHLIETYGCAIVFAAAMLQAAGPPVPGTTVLVAAAVYAAATHGGLPIVGVIVAGAGGAITGTTIGFVIGRRGGGPLLTWIGRRARQGPERVQRLRADFVKHGTAWLFMGRFITGVRNFTGLVAGASGMAFKRFALISAAAAIVWATVNALEYYWFGRALAGASTWLQVLLVAAGLVWMAVSVTILRRRAARRLGSASDWRPESPPA